MWDRVVSEHPFWIVYCPDEYETLRTCDEAVDDSLAGFFRFLDWHIKCENCKSLKNKKLNNAHDVASLNMDKQL